MGSMGLNALAGVLAMGLTMGPGAWTGSEACGPNGVWAEGPGCTGALEDWAFFTLVALSFLSRLAVLLLEEEEEEGGETMRRPWPSEGPAVVCVWAGISIFSAMGVGKK